MTLRQQEKLPVYIVLFLMSLALHVQIPIFTPYATMLGAGSFIIGLLMSASSLANLSGNLVAGPLVDRIGQKVFIVVPLFMSGALMIGHGFADNVTMLMYLRTLNGFALAFLTPAAFALLSSYAKNSREQGKNMAVNGILLTGANIIAPVIGGRMVQDIGYEGTYFAIGAAMLLNGMIAFMFIRQSGSVTVVKEKSKPALTTVLSIRSLHPIYFTGFALMFSQGTLAYELPFLTVERGLSTFGTGKLFSIVSIGTLVSLAMIWMNRFSPRARLVFGMLIVSAAFYSMVTFIIPIQFDILLFVIGIGFGVIMPAIMTAISDVVGQALYGTAFGVMSAVYSAGFILSAFTAGLVRDFISPYFLAFIVSIFAVTFVVFGRLKEGVAPSTNH